MITEQDYLAPKLDTMRVIHPAWANEVRQASDYLVSRLYVFCTGIQTSITLFLGDTSQVVVEDLDPQAESKLAGLEEHYGTYSLENAKAAMIADKLSELSVAEKADCTTNSRGGTLFFHVVVSDDVEHCFAMKNPQLHEDTGYMEVVKVYSEFLGGIL